MKAKAFAGYCSLMKLNAVGASASGSFSAVMNENAFEGASSFFEGSSLFGCSCSVGSS